MTDFENFRVPLNNVVTYWARNIIILMSCEPIIYHMPFFFPFTNALPTSITKNWLHRTLQPGYTSQRHNDRQPPPLYSDLMSDYFEFVLYNNLKNGLIKDNYKIILSLYIPSFSLENGFSIKSNGIEKTYEHYSAPVIGSLSIFCNDGRTSPSSRGRRSLVR